MGKQVNIHEAKTKLSQLLNLVSKGEEITIAKAGQPIARLVPVEHPSPKQAKGLYQGRFEVPDDFDSPLPEDVLGDFYK